MKVHVITIGDEILIGQIIDTNSAWIGKQLNLIGARVYEIRSVSDDYLAIQEAVQHALENADVVLITGGLGPTKDDITKKALADFFKVEMVFSDSTFEHIQSIIKGFGRPMTEAHHQQCYMPSNATLLKNMMGTAPGMWFEIKDKVLVSMPGVPYEMQYLMKNEVIPLLTKKFPGTPIAHRTILTIGEGESRIAERIRLFEDSLPSHIKLAYLPGIAQVRLRLTATGSTQGIIEEELEKKIEELESYIPEIVFGYGEEKFEQVLGKLLNKHKLLLTTAESCTGGYLAHLITSVPGSSQYFQGGIVAYSNHLKKILLNVKEVTLNDYGAVSEPTVLEMVQGAIETTGADIAVAVSGIAGPDGGSQEKPVGTIWFAVGNKNHSFSHKLQLSKDRIKNIQYAGVFGLNMVRRFVLKYYESGN